jgi:hypothetical protein
MSRGLINSFLTGSYLVTRSTAGTFVKGRYVPGSTETVTIKGSLQPLRGKEIKMIAEGERIQDHFTFYSDKPLVIINTKTFADADKVAINGDTYRVVGVESWQSQAGFSSKVDLPHYKSILKREPQQ